MGWVGVGVGEVIHSGCGLLIYFLERYAARFNGVHGHPHCVFLFSLSFDRV